MKLGDVMLAAICGLVIVVSVAHIEPHFSTSNVEQQPYITGRTWREVESSAHLAMDAVDNRSLKSRLTASELWFTEAMCTAVDKNILKGEIK